MRLHLSSTEQAKTLDLISTLTDICQNLVNILKEWDIHHKEQESEIHELLDDYAQKIMELLNFLSVSRVIKKSVPLTIETVLLKRNNLPTLERIIHTFNRIKERIHDAKIVSNYKWKEHEDTPSQFIDIIELNNVLNTLKTLVEKDYIMVNRYSRNSIFGNISFLSSEVLENMLKEVDICLSSELLQKFVHHRSYEKLCNLKERILLKMEKSQHDELMNDAQDNEKSYNEDNDDVIDDEHDVFDDDDSNQSDFIGSEAEKYHAEEYKKRQSMKSQIKIESTIYYIKIMLSEMESQIVDKDKEEKISRSVKEQRETIERRERIWNEFQKIKSMTDNLYERGFTHWHEAMELYRLLIIAWTNKLLLNQQFLQNHQNGWHRYIKDENLSLQNDITIMNNHIREMEKEINAMRSSYQKNKNNGIQSENSENRNTKNDFTKSRVDPKDINRSKWRLSDDDIFG